MWEFLDEMDKNLLYDYTKVLTGRMRQLTGRMRHLNTGEEGISEHERYQQNERIKKRAYYLIWFVYRYVLDCETLQQALEYANDETLKQFHLSVFFSNSQPAIYLGIDSEIRLWYTSDIVIVLEILYNRYGFFEQIDCFIKHTAKYRRRKAIEAKERYLEMLRGNTVEQKEGEES